MVLSELPSGRELDVAVAKAVFGQSDGVDFGTVERHQWIDAEEERDFYQSSFICQRCGASSGWVSESELRVEPCTTDPMPCSNSVALAMVAVLELIGAPDYGVQFRLENIPDGGWRASLEIIDVPWLLEQDLFRRLVGLAQKGEAIGRGIDPPEAICRAILAACTVED